MMSTILLETRHLQKKFGRSQAVSDVSLSVKRTVFTDCLDRMEQENQRL